MLEHLIAPVNRTHHSTHMSRYSCLSRDEPRAAHGTADMNTTSHARKQIGSRGGGSDYWSGGGAAVFEKAVEFGQVAS